jgi:hypothetical protein
MDAACGPACLGCIAARCRYRESRTAAATPRSSQPDACLGAEAHRPAGHFSMRGDRTLSDRSDAQSESAMRCRLAYAVPKPSRDGRNTIANQQRLRQPLRQSIVARLLRGGRRRTRAPIAALCTAAACYGTGLETHCREAIGTQARAMAERCCSAGMGRGADGADGVKCEGAEKRGVFSRRPNQGGACVGRVR